MSSIVTSADGDQIAQHHEDPTWPEDRRLVCRMVRVMGRDPATFDMLICDGPAGNVPDQPSSIGYRNDAALWYPSGQAPPSLTVSDTSTTTRERSPTAPSKARTVALWANGYPGVVQKPDAPPSGTQTVSRAVGAGVAGSDPYRSNVQSKTFALPAYAQDPNDPTLWLADTGLLPQKVAVAGGADLPAGTPVMLVPFSITTEQQMAAIPCGNQLVAVWFGGKDEGKLGTLEYDVKPDGSLDPQRRVRLQSRDRIYRLPTSGLLSFGADPGAAAKPFPVSSGLAWQIGLDVDSQAGYGLVVDQVADTVQVPTPTRTATGDFSNAGLSGAGQSKDTPTDHSRPNTPEENKAQADQVHVSHSTGSTVSPPDHPGTVSRGGGTPQTTSAKPVFGVTSKRGYGGFSVGQVKDKHHLADTPDDEPVNSAHWNVQQPIDGDGYDAPLETAGLYQPTTRGGPLIVPVFFRYDPKSEHQFLDGTREGLRRWETTSVFDTPPPARDKPGEDKGSDKTGGYDKGYVDKNPSDDKQPGDDKDGAKDSNPSKDGSTGNKDYNPGKDSNPGDDKTGTSDKNSDFTKARSPAEDKALNDYRRTGKKDINPSFDQGGNNSSPHVTGTNVVGQVGQTAGTQIAFTFGGGVLYNGGSPLVRGEIDPGSASTIAGNRSYARTPLELAVPGILGLPTPLNGIDLRGRASGLTPEQRVAYNQPRPISGVISPVASQVGGSFNWFAGAHPGTAQFLGGVANAGGFVLHPGNVDIKEIQTGASLPASMPVTTFMAATPFAQFAVADPTESGIPSNGFSWSRASSTKMAFNVLDGTGAAGASPALALDSVAQNATSWGGTLVNAKDGAAGQVPIADGAGGATWGTNGGSSNPNCVYGDGSDGAVALDGTNTFAGFTTTTGAAPNLVYTLTRDLYASTLTVSVGKTINTAGFRVFASTSLVNNGTIQNNGASVGVGGAPAGTLGGGANGGAGAVGSNAPSSYGAAGGAGGGHAGGTAIAPVAAMTSIHSYPNCITGTGFQGGTGVTYDGGAGGGGAAFGGGGGGVIVIASPSVTNSATGTIQANGGPGNGGLNNGGGGGGFVNIACPVASYSNLGTVQALGGAPQGSGAAGSNGTVFNIAP